MLTRLLTRRTATLLAVPALLLSGCAGPPDPAGTTTAGTSEDSLDGRVDAAGVLGAVATAPDGTTFSIGDLAGQQVFVETFATWCSKCRRQLGDTQQAAAEAGDAAVFLVLSVETTLDPAELTAYAADNGFTDVRFGVLSPEGLAAFDEAFGSSVLNAPSTPKFIVGPDGTLSALTTGFESPEEILAQLDA